MVETFFCSLLCIFKKCILSIFVVLNFVILKPSANIQRLLFLASGFIIFFLIPFTIFAILNIQNMFHRIIKLIIAGLTVVAGIWQFIEGNVGNGIFLIVLTAFPVFLYYKNEFILLAFLKLRKQDFEGAKKWLAYIKNPETALVRKQQGYFNYLHGIMLSQTNLNQSEKYFKKAIELGLSMDMDLAVAKLNLAGIAMSRRRKLEATNLLNEAKKLDKQNMLSDQIKMMKDQMKKI
jgi:tetratricopeptide (TPR) repeat protein